MEELLMESVKEVYKFGSDVEQENGEQWFIISVSTRPKRYLVKTMKQQDWNKHKHFLT